MGILHENCHIIDIISASKFSTYDQRHLKRAL